MKNLQSHIQEAKIEQVSESLTKDENRNACKIAAYIKSLKLDQKEEEKIVANLAIMAKHDSLGSMSSAVFDKF